MTTSVETSARAESGLLGPRVTGLLLDRLAARAVTAGPREQVPIEMPATGKILGHVPHGTPDDVAAAADTARQAQPGWARTHVTDRSKVLLRRAAGCDAAGHLRQGNDGGDAGLAAAARPQVARWPGFLMRRHVRD